MAELGFEVLGVDTDAARIAALSVGNLPFFEPGLEPLLRRGLSSAGSASRLPTCEWRSSARCTSCA
jgi:UDP-glucose 6-dehydrogenase